MIRRMSVALAVAGLLAGAAYAVEHEQGQQDPQTPEQRQQGQAQHGQQDRQTPEQPHQGQMRRGQQDSTHVLKASETVGLTVVNQADRQLGEVYDLVVSSDGQRISHVIVSAGGFLGLGDKLLPVPTKAVSFVEKSEEEEHWVVKVDITEERLKEAPSMEGDDWSGLTDAEWAGELNAYYDIQGDEQQARQILKVNDLIGMSIRNGADQDAEEIGELNEIVFESDSGKIRYAALSFGGWLGIGDKLFAVPWKDISFTKSTGDEQVRYLTLAQDISRDALENAEGFGAEDWPATADENWLSGKQAEPRKRVAEREEDYQR